MIYPTILSVFLLFFLLWPQGPSLADDWQTVVGGRASTRETQPQPPLLRPEEKIPNPEPLTSSERTTAKDILESPGSSPEKRCAWYTEKISRFSEDIITAAQREKIPAKLLATVLLNELADVDITDVTQDLQLAETKGSYEEYKFRVDLVALWWKSINKQSFGIGQISPDTAIRYDAVYVPGKEHMTRDKELAFHVAYRLLDRRINIAAAAKITRGILKEIEARQTSDWVKQFIRPGQRFSADNPTAALFPKTGNDGQSTDFVRGEREKRLAQLVTAVYNSGNILTPGPNQIVPDALDDRTHHFPNALKHSQNAASIAEDLHGTDGCGLVLETTQDCENFIGNYGVYADELVVTHVAGESNITVGQTQKMRPAGVFKIAQADDCHIVVEFRASQIEGRVAGNLATLTEVITGTITGGTLLKISENGKTRLKVILKTTHTDTGAVITREGKLTLN